MTREPHYPYQTHTFLQELMLDDLVRSRFLVPVPSICCWMDISGFADKLAKADWNLNTAQAIGLLAVLRRAYEIGAMPSITEYPPDPSEKVLILNDGIAKAFDLPRPSSIHWRTFLFYLRNTLLPFYNLVSRLNDESLGLRMVLAGGERIQYTPIRITGERFLMYSGKPSKRGKRYLEEEFVYHPAEFQMNTAFSKAFLIESAGSKSGVEMNRVYVEETYLSMIEKVMPGWLKIEGKSDGRISFQVEDKIMFHMTFDKVIPFKSRYLKTRIFQLSNFVVHKAMESEATYFPLKLKNINKLHQRLKSEYSKKYGIPDE